MLDTISNIEIKHVIFDIDGTLVESIPDEVTLFFDLLTQKLDSFIIRDVNYYKERTFSGIINQVTEGLTINQKIKLSEEIDNEMAQYVTSQKWSAKPEGLALYNKALELNKNLYFVTGNWQQSSTFKLESIGIKSVNRIFSTSIKKDSKKAIIAQLIANKPTSSFISIGDSKYDEESSLSLGISFLLI